MFNDATAQNIPTPEAANLLEFIPTDMIVPENRRIDRPENIRWLIGNLEIKNRRHPALKETIEKLWTALRDNHVARKGR